MEVFISLSLLSLIAGEYDYGYRVDNQLLKSFNDTGKRSCCKECISYTNCQSVNYNKNNYSCELNYQHISGPGKAIHAEYVYMDRSHCFSLASCSEVLQSFLQYQQKCVLTSTNQPACIISECDPTSTIPDITPKHVRRELGLSHWLWCKVPPTDSIQLFTCDTDGKWINNYTSCICWYGTYLDGNNCTKCPTGTYLPYYNKVGLGSCIDCPVGQHSPSPGSSSCIDCPAGRHSPSPGSSSCIDCPVGYYAPDPGRSNCIACPVGYYQSSTGRTTCKRCRPGRYNSGLGKRICKLCPVGTYQNLYGQTSCKTCDTALVEGSTVC